NQFICPIVYQNEMPDLAVDCKFLPCGKNILEYTIEPVSFPEQESKYEHRFRGLHLLFDLDLVNQSVYDKPQQQHPQKMQQQMDPRDAALLSDIEALHCVGSKPRPSRNLECSQMFAKERVLPPRPRPGLQRAPPDPKTQINLEPIGLQEQREMVNHTFEEIKKQIGRHPTNRSSRARPICVLPIFPDTDLGGYTFVQLQFDIPPAEHSQSLIRDCGNYLVNFNAKQEVGLNGEQIYLSDQRYKEEKHAENSERGERFILREKDGSIFYTNVDKHIKLRRERPRPQAVANKCLL
ncbi:hypothetical protein KR009_000940, partial [Drosophila setifemur]